MGQAISNIDWDDALAYPTMKVVRIRHKWVGLSHKLLLVAIFFYIVIWLVILKKGYMLRDTPVGNVAFSLQPNADPLPPEKLKYCTQNVDHVDAAESCVHWDNFEMSKIMESSVTVGTRITFEEQTRCNDWETQYNCPWSEGVNEKTVFVGQAEEYTLKVAHDMRGQVVDITGGSWQTGFTPMIEGPEGSEPVMLHISAGDIFPLKSVLDVVGLDLDGFDKADNATYRYNGKSIIVEIEYDNIETGEVRYKYVASLTNNEAKIENVNMYSPTQRYYYNIHGVQLIFLQTGTLGAFDFPTLLLTLVSGLALTSIAATVADLLLMYVMPRREDYKLFKFANTPDFDPDDEQERRVLAKILAKKRRKLQKIGLGDEEKNVHPSSLESPLVRNEY